jgi:hypothetical protein
MMRTDDAPVSLWDALYGRRSFLRTAAHGLGALALADALGFTAFAQPPVARYNGFIVLRLKPTRFGSLLSSANDLRALARQSNATELIRVLDQYPSLTTGRLISALTPSQVGELEKRGPASPESRLTSYWTIDAEALGNRDQLIQLLRNLPDVDLVYEEPVGLDPASIDPSDDQFSYKQFHLKPAPEGIDAVWAWRQGAGSAPSVGFADVERGWILTHEDMPTRRTLPYASTEMVSGSLPHGTACITLAAGRDNDKGIVGVAPNPAWTGVSSHVRGGRAGRVAVAIAAAAYSMKAGDVLLVEWATDDDLPAETVAAVWTIISLATAAGIVVVEAGGNGNKSLDSVPELKADSGAIIVGAAHRALDATGLGHERWLITLPSGTVKGSNFGARIDCYAPGEQLVAAGPSASPAGSLTPTGTPVRRAYRSEFGGTSGAAAIVAGAALLLQQWHIAIKHQPLKPAVLRTVFRTVGTPQGSAVAGHIGRMPDLKKAAAALGLGAVPPSVPSIRRDPT